MTTLELIALIIWAGVVLFILAYAGYHRLK